jgi:hypothetical protein
MIDFINGNKFDELAHFVIYPPGGYVFKPEILKQNAIIYSKPEYLKYLFDNLKYAINKYIVISHASDYSIDYNYFFHKPLSVKLWFAQNALYDHPSLMPIPIGVENTISRYGSVYGQCADLEYLSENENRFKNKTRIEDTVFCAWRNITNPMRSGVIDSFKKSGIKYHYVERLEYKDYCETVSSYKFIASPPGNGLDCHKTWEILYMGSIPIVIKNRIYKFYKLPILQVNKFEDVTPDLLKDFLSNRPEYNMKELTMGYWKTLIEEEFNKLNA